MVSAFMLSVDRVLQNGTCTNRSVGPIQRNSERVYLNPFYLRTIYPWKSALLCHGAILL